MKKYIFLPLAALALGFAACEDDDSLGIPVVNPEIPAVDPSIVSVAPSSEMPPVISLESYNNDGINVPVATITSGEEWPAGYDFGAVAQISADESFSKPFEVSTLVNGTTILLNPEDIQGFVYDNITKSPDQQTLWLRFGIQAVNGKEVIRLGNADSFIGAEKIEVLPFSPAAVIEPAYYLILSYDGENWAAANAYKFSHSDKSPYDDPTFSLLIDIPANQYADGAYWMILPESTYDDNFNLEGFVIGATEDDAEKRSGKLDESDDHIPGYIDIFGSVMFEINIDRVGALKGAKDVMTFSYKQAIENFWIAGDGVIVSAGAPTLSWSFSEQPTMWTKNYFDYAGVAVLTSQFKFSPTNGWNGDFGGSAEFSTQNGELIGKGSANSGDNISVPEAGFYYIGLNYASKDLTIVKIDNLGIIGGFNDWSESVNMTKVDDFTYTITQTLSKGNEWKIRANGQWTVSFGGTFDNINPFNGSNFVCDEDGTYEITLHLGSLPWTADVVKK